MKVVRDLSLLKRERRPIVLAIGFFDGVHSGHQRVVGKAITRAHAIGGRAWVLTFAPHPLQVLAPAGAPPLLTCLGHKLRLLAGLGVDGCVVMPFTRALAALPPERFVGLLRACAPPLSEILVGKNWRFGRRGVGTPAALSRLCRGTPIKVSIIPSLRREGGPVSSTRVRREVVRGHLDTVAALLGRPFSILGTVVRGRGVGRRIGFATANLDPHGEALPPFGVYAVRARLGRRLMGGVLSIGVRPTFRTRGKAKPSFELHIPGVRRDLYGADIEVVFVSKLREERRFASVDALAQQIALDVAEAKRLTEKR